MYDFHYNFVLPKYDKNCKLMYMDTDCFIYELKCKNFYKDVKKNLNLFDTSDYPKNNKYKIPLINKKTVGKFKDECAGNIITEFVGIRSKMYSLRVEGIDNIKKAKGIKNYIVNNKIDFDDYYDCLKNNTLQFREQCCVR